MNNPPRPSAGRMLRTLRRQPGRCALFAAAVAVALVVLVLAAVGRGGSTEAGRLERWPSTTATATAATASGTPPDEAPGGRESPTTEQAPPGEPSSGTTARGAARRPAGAGVEEGSEPVAPRAPVRCQGEGRPAAGPLPPPDERDGLRWVTVGRLTGSCDASSEPFQLLGVDTRLVWRSDADSFAVFVVDVVQGRDASAGFSDGQCAGPCSETQPIVLVAGRYTLEVQAGEAPWEVEVQEYRRP